MLLWKDTFPASTCTTDAHADDPAEPWRAWPRPPGGFVDIGYAPSCQRAVARSHVACSCGNGLLVHILVSEGYAGFGFDVRARKSWTGFPPATRAALRVHALDPTLASSSSPVPTADNADGTARSSSRTTRTS
jgi:tRNASer (uridine44-2'-O)-methyltransferase